MIYSMLPKENKSNTVWKIKTDLCLGRNFTKVIGYRKASMNSCLLKQSDNIKTPVGEVEIFINKQMFSKSKPQSSLNLLWSR